MKRQEAMREEAAAAAAFPSTGAITWPWQGFKFSRRLWQRRGEKLDECQVAMSLWTADVLGKTQTH